MQTTDRAQIEQEIESYKIAVMDAFHLFLLHGAPDWRSWHEDEVRDLILARIREMGYAVANIGGYVDDALALATQVWNAIVMNLTLAHIRHGVSGMHMVTRELRRGYESHPRFQS